MIKYVYSFILFMIFHGLTYAQSGIRGKIYDAQSGESISFADVMVSNITLLGTNSDLDGAYSLLLEPGIYSIVVSYLGYTDMIIDSIHIEKDNFTQVDIPLRESAEELTEIVVTATQARNTEAAITLLQRNTASFIDGLSSQTFSRTGDSHAGSAIKRVSGVSVENGQYVFIRGLGDRYSKVLLNGMDIPGLDPDVNSVQLDIFPTNLVDNIIVYKTFTPDLSGDFAGGIVRLNTKNFPERKTLEANIGMGYTPTVHLDAKFISAPVGDLDWLGIDDGSRKLPFSKYARIPDNTEGNPQLTTMTSSLDPRMATFRQMQFLNHNASISMGDQLNKEKATWGYNFSLSYSHHSTFDNNASYTEWERDPQNFDVYELRMDRSRTGAVSTVSDMWSGLLGGSLKYKKHRFALSLLRSQMGQNKAAKIVSTGGEDNTLEAIYKDVIEYSEKSITNIMLSGKHVFDQSKMEIEWKIAPTLSQINEPDIRQTGFELIDGTLQIRPSTGAVVERVWRNLNEQNVASKIDLVRSFNWINHLESKLKLGALYTYKNRDFEILNYRLNIENQGSLSIDGNPDNILKPEHISQPDQRDGVYLVGNYEPANSYDGQQHIIAGYLMSELAITQRLRSIFGARVESNRMYYSGQNNNGTVLLDNEKTLDKTVVLPSSSFIYAIGNDMNVRLSYAATVARPSFKEKSFAQIYDRISDRFFLGNLDLEQTYIHHADMRWEYFMPSGQAISLSTFYKYFDNPIEIVTYSSAAASSFTPRNINSATIYGMEVELKKRLDIFSLPRFSFMANITLVRSRTQMNDAEYDSRVQRARSGQKIDRYRDMAFQPPYVINAGLNYKDAERGWEGNISYNVQGSRLVIVGIGDYPDVYAQPFHSLTAKISKRMKGGLSMSIAASNLLAQDRIEEYVSYRAKNRLFSRFDPGQTFSLSIGYRFY